VCVCVCVCHTIYRLFAGSCVTEYCIVNEYSKWVDRSLSIAALYLCTDLTRTLLATYNLHVASLYHERESTVSPCKHACLGNEGALLKIVQKSEGLTQAALPCSPSPCVLYSVRTSLVFIAVSLVFCLCSIYNSHLLDT